LNNGKKRPKGAATPSGLKNKHTIKNSITLIFLIYTPGNIPILQASLICKSISDLSTQLTSLREGINHFIELYHITEDQMEVCIHV